MEVLGGIRMIGNSVVYKNTLYVFATKDENMKELFLVALDLDSKALDFACIHMIRCWLASSKISRRRKS